MCELASQIEGVLLNPASPNAVSWLRGIFQKRLGTDVQLTVDKQNWYLTCPNESKAIEFSRQFAKLEPGDESIPFSMIELDQEMVPGLEKGTLQLPAPGTANPHSPLIVQQGTSVHILYDVPGLCYWALARVEELGRFDALDEHQRFPATASHAHRHGYLDRPVVDEWLNIVQRIAVSMWGSIEVPQNLPSLTVSHDVDDPLRYGFTSFPKLIKRVAGDILVHKNVLAPWHAFNSWLSQTKSLYPYDPFNTFEWVMDLSDRAGIKSTFYFITEPDKESVDPRFNFRAGSIGVLMRRISKRGHIIGLHPSYGSFLTPEKIASEVGTLAKAMQDNGLVQAETGARMHYLQWRMPITPRALAAAGMSHDASVGYADAPGFRCGTAHPYPAFDALDDCEIGIEIRPLIVMEVSLLASKYQGNSDISEVRNSIQKYIVQSKAVGGTCSLLWHNSSFVEAGHRWIYEQVVTGETK